MSLNFPNTLFPENCTGTDSGIILFLLPLGTVLTVLLSVGVIYSGSPSRCHLKDGENAASTQTGPPSSSGGKVVVIHQQSPPMKEMYAIRTLEPDRGKLNSKGNHPTGSRKSTFAIVLTLVRTGMTPSREGNG
jgi:hypothetical protein